MRLQHQSFTLFADYHQFYLWDAGMTDQAPEDWTDDDCRRRIKTGWHVVVVIPGRNTTVPVEVEVHDTEPGFDPTGRDHIAEASLHLPTGRLQVHECTGGPAADFVVAPGWYRVRAFYGGFATITWNGLRGGDHYRVVLWPSPPADLRVVKQHEPG